MEKKSWLCIICTTNSFLVLTHLKHHSSNSLLFLVSLILSLIGSFRSAYKHLYADNSLYSHNKNEKTKNILTLMSSSNNCLIFLLPFTVRFLQLSTFISNSSTFFWNHTVHVFNSHHPTRWLAMVISNGIDIAKSIGQASELIWFDPMLNTVDHSPVWTVFQNNILSYFFLITILATS